MTARTTAIAVPYSAGQMYALVADVERYPEFLPWCAALRVVSRRSDGGVELMTAEMTVAYKVFREQFRSLVRLDPDARRIEVDYVDGLFRNLQNRWAFENGRDGGSIVRFDIAFEFRNILLQTAARAVFDKAFARMSDAFVARAHALYGGGER